MGPKYERLSRAMPSGAHGVNRREFVRICTLAAAALGLPASAAQQFVFAASRGLKPSLVWLHFQECTGCTESLLRSSHPALSQLILDLVSLDYHETLFAAAGYQAEAALKKTMEDNKGKYICVVEGAIPTRDGGVYCKIAGKPAIDMLREVAAEAAAIVAIGSCAAWGGIPSADPNPTGATGAPQILTNRTVVSLPGCPPNPYILLGTVLQYLVLGSLPALDDKGRPLFAYGRTIHDVCPRRSHFDAGHFAERFGDEGHRQGYCLYKLGCKGPATHASCATQHFGDIDGAWPIGIGHPCFGCTEQALAFRVPLHQTIEIERPMPPDTYPPIHAEQRGINPVATGVAGLVGGALLTAGLMASRKLGKRDAEGPSSGGPDGSKED